MDKDVFVVIISAIVGGLVAYYLAKKQAEPKLNFGGHFKPHRHFFFEKCSRCGKRLKRYHCFWGKGDKMYCDVDYDGNTEWYCEKCEEETSKNVELTIPRN